MIVMEDISISKKELGNLSDIFSSFIKNKTVPAFSMLLGEDASYSIKSVKELSLKGVDDIVLPYMNEQMYGVYLKAEGEMRISMLCFMMEKQGLDLAAKLLGKDKVDVLDHMGRSSLSEVGNILLAGSFLNAISNWTGFKIDCSAPGFAIETLHTLIEDPVSEISADTKYLVMSEVDIVGAKSGITIHLFLIFRTADMKKILAKGEEAA
jgi:chemotaxis protein CheY-P-specific phosphatase CheC